jgi:hypothetical protein
MENNFYFLIDKDGKIIKLNKVDTINTSLDIVFREDVIGKESIYLHVFEQEKDNGTA